MLPLSSLKVSSVKQSRIRGCEACRCRNLHSTEKLFKLVLEAVRDADDGNGVNPNDVRQYIRQYHRVPIDDEPFDRIIKISLSKGLISGLINRFRGGRYYLNTDANIRRACQDAPLKRSRSASLTRKTKSNSCSSVQKNAVKNCKARGNDCNPEPMPDFRPGPRQPCRQPYPEVEIPVKNQFLPAEGQTAKGKKSCAAKKAKTSSAKQPQEKKFKSVCNAKHKKQKANTQNYFRE